MTENIIIASIGFLGSVVAAVISGLFASRSKRYEEESKGLKTECEQIKTEITTKISNNQKQENKVIVNPSIDTEKIKEIDKRFSAIEKQLKDINDISEKTKEELEAECKKNWDNLDDDEKKELKQFKSKNTIILYVELPVVIGLLRKGILQQIQNAYYSSAGILIASCRINPDYKEFLTSL